ncbi:MAG: bactofilin family protein [Alphaproteobacteria bacterium]|jgi:cytoskeletal protein CcmA (bactofilin family)
MFSKNKKNAKDERALVPPSILGVDLKIKGNLATEGDIQIDGVVEGNVSSKTLTIGEKAVVTGNVMCDEVFIAGVIHGGINARVVEIGATATVVGDIHHESLSIEAGATVDGFCKHILRRDSDVSPSDDVSVAGAASKADPYATLTRPSLVVGADPKK